MSGMDKRLHVGGAEPVLPEKKRDSAYTYCTGLPSTNLPNILPEFCFLTAQLPLLVHP